MGILIKIASKIEKAGKWLWNRTFGRRVWKIKEAARILEEKSWEDARMATPHEITDEEIRKGYDERKRERDLEE